MAPPKVWLHRALGCNHQSFACPSYSLDVQLLWYPNLVGFIRLFIRPSPFYLAFVSSHSILEDNKSRVSGGIQARLHRPLSHCHSNAKETKLVIGWKLLSLGRPNPKISLLLRLRKWRHAFFENSTVAKSFWSLSLLIYLYFDCHNPNFHCIGIFGNSISPDKSPTWAIFADNLTDTSTAGVITDHTLLTALDDFRYSSAADNVWHLAVLTYNGKKPAAANSSILHRWKRNLGKFQAWKW